MKLLILMFALVFALFFEVQSIASEHSSSGPGSFFPEPKPDLTKQNIPQSPLLKQPSFDSQVNVENLELTWDPSPEAESYHVQVATDPNFKWLVAEQNLITTNSLKVENLEKGKSYFWRVASIKSSNMNQFTKSRFTVSKFQTK